MALNKLKKWIGTQAMAAFFDQLNDNVDATNAAIDLLDLLKGENLSHLVNWEETPINAYVSFLGPNFVYMHFQVTTVSTTGTLVATLPPEMRPTGVRYVSSNAHHTRASQTLIASSGEITCYVGTEGVIRVSGFFPINL